MFNRQPRAAVLRVFTETELDESGQVVSSRSWTEPIGATNPNSASAESGGNGSNGQPAPVSSRQPAPPSSTSGGGELSRVQQQAWERALAKVLHGEELWTGFAGRTASEILGDVEVRREVACLQLSGVTNAPELVLRAGPARCRQVRVWVDRKRKQQEVRNPAALIADRILNGVPKGVRPKA